MRNMAKGRKDLTPRISVRGNAKMNLQTAGANVKVVVRIRPHNEKENKDNFKTVVKAIDEKCLIFDPEEDAMPFFYHGVEQKGRDLLKKANKNMQFNFDQVFNLNSSNEEVFLESTMSLIDKLMDGCNCSVFAYGATGAGKTHTMLGNSQALGITYLTMQELFSRKSELMLDRNFELAVSYLEVYNESVQDLLKPGGQSLHLREDCKLGVIVAGITLKRIENAEELFELLEKGNKCRTQHPTDSNAESSRSHAVFQVYIRMSMKETGQTRLAKLSMIDLAGSERGAATGFKGARFTEGANINKSLLALGNCINSLASGLRHVPYRDSKLTRLLKDSLGGNCQTVMIANVSPSSMSYEDTYNTLKYATRAKKIKSNVKKNVVNTDLNSAQYLRIIEDLNKENQRLKNTQGSCEKCLGIRSNEPEETITKEILETPSAPVEIPEPEPEPQTPTKLEFLYEEVKSLQERLLKLKMNKSVLEVRVDIKEEANHRLSNFCLDTCDKENGHKKLLETLSRLKLQATTFSAEMDQLKSQLEVKNMEISSLLAECPELKIPAEVLQLKMENMVSDINLDEMRNIDKVKSKELEGRGILVENMINLLEPWFYIMRANGLLTDTMINQYEDLRKYVEGVCSVSFDEAEIPLSQNLTICISGKGEDTEGVRAMKRKWQNELDSTFVLTNAPALTRFRTEQALGKASSPRKTASKVMKSPHRLKENRAVTTKKVGTMGTSSRFPSALTSSTRIRTAKPIKRKPFV